MAGRSHAVREAAVVVEGPPFKATKPILQHKALSYGAVQPPLTIRAGPYSDTESSVGRNTDISFKSTKGMT